MNPELCDPTGKHLLTFRFNVKIAEKCYHGAIPSQDLEIFLTNITEDDRNCDDKDEELFNQRMRLFTEVFYNQLTTRNDDAGFDYIPAQVLRDVAAIVGAHYSQIALLYFEWRGEPFQKAFINSFRKTEDLISRRKHNKSKNTVPDPSTSPKHEDESPSKKTKLSPGADIETLQNVQEDAQNNYDNDEQAQDL